MLWSGTAYIQRCFCDFFCVVRISSSQDGLPLTPSCSVDTAWPQSHGCDPLPPCLTIFARLYCQYIYMYFLVPLCHFPFSSCKGKTPSPPTAGNQISSFLCHFLFLSFPARVKSPDSWKPNFSIAKVYRRNVGLSDFGL